MTERQSVCEWGETKNENARENHLMDELMAVGVCMRLCAKARERWSQDKRWWEKLYTQQTQRQMVTENKNDTQDENEHHVHITSHRPPGNLSCRGLSKGTASLVNICTG